MDKNNLAFQVFLKKMPAERFNDTTTRAYIGAAQDSLAIAELFINVVDSSREVAMGLKPAFSEESDL